MIPRTPYNLYAVCVVCGLFNNLNKRIRGNYYCPIHQQLEEDKPVTIRYKKRHDNDLEEVRSILQAKDIIYEIT